MNNVNKDRDDRGKFVEGSEAARRAGQKGGKSDNKSRNQQSDRDTAEKSDNARW